MNLFKKDGKKPRRRLRKILEQHDLWAIGEKHKYEIGYRRKGQQARLENANLSKLNLESTNLSIARLDGADLRSSNLANADLTRAKLIGADLRKADLRGASLVVADLEGAKLVGADLRKADFTYAHLIGADLGEVKLGEAKFKEAKLWRTNLRGVDLSGVSFREASFHRADLRDTKLIGADLTEADLMDADLMGANLTEANLSKARLLRTNFLEADLSGAKLVGADLSQVRLRGSIGLTLAQLSKVKTLHRAELDPELERQVKEEHPGLFDDPTPHLSPSKATSKGAATLKKPIQAQTALYAYMAQVPGGLLPGTVANADSNEELKQRIRQEAGGAGLDVMIYPPEEWNAPEIKSLTQPDLAAVFPLVMAKVQAHMAKKGLPAKDPQELIRTGSVMPQPLTGVVFFVYRVQQPRG